MEQFDCEFQRQPAKECNQFLGCWHNRNLWGECGGNHMRTAE